jgi:hypothetical protein
MRIVAALLLAALAAGGAEARLVGAGEGKSWGKAGVSLDRYRAEGLACAREAAATDLRGTDPARALVIASRLIESDPTGSPPPMVNPNAGPAAGIDPIAAAGSAASIVSTIGPQRQILKAGDIMKAKLEACLLRAGYQKFRLTHDQQRRLRGFREGSEARRAYLHSLAADPEILSRQKVR